MDSDDLQTTLGAYLSSNWTASEASQYFIKINDFLDVIPSNQSLSDFIILTSSEDPKIRNKHLKTSLTLSEKSMIISFLIWRQQ